MTVHQPGRAFCTQCISPLCAQTCASRLLWCLGQADLSSRKRKEEPVATSRLQPSPAQAVSAPAAADNLTAVLPSAGTLLLERSLSPKARALAIGSKDEKCRRPPPKQSARECEREHLKCRRASKTVRQQCQRMRLRKRAHEVSAHRRRTSPRLAAGVKTPPPPLSSSPCSAMDSPDSTNLHAHWHGCAQLLPASQRVFSRKQGSGGASAACPEGPHASQPAEGRPEVWPEMHAQCRARCF